MNEALSLKEKLDLIDQQIDKQKEVYNLLTSKEKYVKTNVHVTSLGSIPTCNWSNSTLRVEREIFARIDELQEAKNRLITGERLPEIVYVDKEVVKIKYIDRKAKNINIYKPSLAISTLWFVGLVHSLVLAAWYYGLISVIVRTNF